MTTISKKANENVIRERKPKIWTPGQIVLMIVILAVEVIIALFSRKSDQEDEEAEAEPARA